MYYIEYPYLDQEAEIEIMAFPGGEPHVKIDTIPDDEVCITYTAKTWDDFGDLVMLLNALYHQDKKIILVMPYFPGARQDRNPGGNTPLTVEAYARILAPYVYKIVVADVHSPKALEIIAKYIRNVKIIYPFHILPHFFNKAGIKFDYIIAPDKGALTRATLVANKLNIPVIECEKVRDFNTGVITSYTIPGEIKPGRYLVVDDICDGGATFNILGQSFRDQMPSDGLLSADPSKWSTLCLYVTHPIFSKGLETILQFYEHIYTTDSLDFYHLDTPENKLTIIPLEAHVY